MIVKQFLFGPPGSGKSTVARHVIELMREKYPDWYAIRISDYDILYNLFKDDKEGKRFIAIEKGFSVRDHTVYNEALIILQDSIKHLELSENTKTLVIIEFARPDYIEVSNLFPIDFFKCAHFLYLGVDLTTCRNRVQKRSLLPTSPDDSAYFDNHNVPERFFALYNDKDTVEYAENQCLALQKYFQEKSTPIGCLEVIPNNGLVEDCLARVDTHINSILLRPDSVSTPSGSRSAPISLTEETVQINTEPLPCQIQSEAVLALS